MNRKNIYILVLFTLLITVMNCSNKISSQIREPAVAGQFYPSGPDELKSMVQNFLDNVPITKIDGQIYGIIVPHAGYIFSGQVAAYSYKILQGTGFDTIILIGQSHNFHLTKPAIYYGDKFKTPLGEVSIDKEFAKELINTNVFEQNNQAHIPEHSLEVEIPFLQVVLKNFKIVPILLSDMGTDLTKYERISKILITAIKKLKHKKVLIVVSTDMSHYPSYNEANIVDKETLKLLQTYDINKFQSSCSSFLNKGIQNLACTYCGNYAVITGMYITKSLGANKTEILHYSNSGDIPNYGDKNRVVGYCSVAFINDTIKKSENIQRTLIMKDEKFNITEKNQKLLLELARNTIKEYLITKKQLTFTTTDPELLQKSAVFVTLTKTGQLRGCIGTTVPQVELYLAVQQMALSSSFDDYRFGPVDTNELKDIKIEISVLSPMKRVKSADEIQPQRDGVVVRKAMRSGLFLPQVWEHFPNDKEGFLSELCSQKAGLERDAWKTADIELYTFTVFAFEEH